MQNTLRRTRSMTGGKNHRVASRAHSSQIMRTIGRSSGSALKQARRSYRRAATAIRRNPQTTVALALLGTGLVAGIVVGVIMRRRVMSSQLHGWRWF